jgi:hypothetical protein
MRCRSSVRPTLSASPASAPSAADDRERFARQDRTMPYALTIAGLFLAAKNRTQIQAIKHAYDLLGILSTRNGWPSE